MSKVDILIENSRGTYTLSSEDGSTDDILPLFFDLFGAVLGIRKAEKDKLLENFDKVKEMMIDLGLYPQYEVALTCDEFHYECKDESCEYAKPSQFPHVHKIVP